MDLEDFADRLRRLHQHTSELRSLFDRIHVGTPADATVGTDPSGAVRVTVDPDGVPQAIGVQPGWQRRTSAEGLAGCVLAAYQAAAGKVLRALTGTVEADAWLTGDSRAEAGDREEGVRKPSPPPAPVHGQPRDPLILTEEILKALHTARTRAATPVPMYLGQAVRGTVSVTLSPAGLHGCAIEPAWARRQSSATLNAALRKALDSARARLAAGASSRRAEANLLDTLAAEALATLARVTGEPNLRKATEG